MPAWKALLFIVVIGGLAAFGFFVFVPGARPAIVKSWFRSAQGFKPAKTPNECMDKFTECIRKRDYETAADLYCGGEYREELRKGAKAGTALGEGIDDLWNAAFDVEHLNAPQAKMVLYLIDPFPKAFVTKNIEHKEGEDTAWATVIIGEMVVDPKDLGGNITGWNYDPRMVHSLVPPDYMIEARVIPEVKLEMKYEGQKEKSWKVYFPVTGDIPGATSTGMFNGLRDKVQYLRDNYGNYMQALKNLKYAVKHEAVTKSDFEHQLKTELNKAK